MLIELHSGKQPDPLNYVSCLLRVGGGWLKFHRFLTPSCNTDISGTQYGHIVNWCDKDVSVSRRLRLFGYVRQSPLFKLLPR